MQTTRIEFDFTSSSNFVAHILNVVLYTSTDLVTSKYLIVTGYKIYNKRLTQNAEHLNILL